MVAAGDLSGKDRQCDGSLRVMTGVQESHSGQVRSPSVALSSAGDAVRLALGSVLLAESLVSPTNRSKRGG
jgi:hypothetical protein